MALARVHDCARTHSGIVDKAVLVKRFAEDGLTTADYLRAATGQPQLFAMSPETIADKHILPVVDRFAADGLTTRDYLRVATRQPPLFIMSPQTIAGHITGVVDRFAEDGLTTRGYLQAAIELPSLFTMSPETVSRHITGVVDRFAEDGLTTEDYLRAAIKQPSLFAMSPETAAGHITGVADRFAADGLTTRDYLRAAIKQPSLFAMSPETAAGHITGVVDRFAEDGLTTRGYLQAALKLPQLFARASSAIIRNIDLVLGLYDKGVLAMPRPRGRNDERAGQDHPRAAVIAFLLRNPALLTLEDNNYVLRELHQRMTGADPSPENLLRSRRQTEHQLMRHLGHDDPQRPVPDGFIAGQAPPTEDQARSFVLRALIREGYIKGGHLQR